jgi:hypothetical protein
MCPVNDNWKGLSMLSRFLLMAFVLSIIAALVVPSSGRAQGGMSAETEADTTVTSPLSFNWQANLLGGLHFGETSYRYDGPGVGSELIFPLDLAVGGVQADFFLRRDGRTVWSVTARAAIGLSDPDDPFTDRDWYWINPGLEVNFSYTESDVDVSMVMLDLEGSRLLYADGPLSLSLIAGVGYQKVSQEALGYVGAQLIGRAGDTSLVYRSISSDRRALTYDITYLTPRLGIRPRLAFGDRFVFEASAAGSPLVYIDDRDEHLLRFFTAEADGRGYGFFAEGELEYRLGDGRRFVRLFGDMRVIGADLSAAIKWYGDDPADPEDNTGQIALGIPHDIRSTQYSVRVAIGTEF